MTVQLGLDIFNYKSMKEEGDLKWELEVLASTACMSFIGAEAL